MGSLYRCSDFTMHRDGAPALYSTFWRIEPARNYLEPYRSANTRRQVNTSSLNSGYASAL